MASEGQVRPDAGPGAFGADADWWYLALMRTFLSRCFPALSHLDLAGWIIGLLALIVGLSCLMAFVVIAVGGPLMCENFAECTV